MGARSGNNYLSSLRKLKAEVWIGTIHVPNPAIHPAFVTHARAIASLYDLQIEHPGAMTYRLDDGDRVGLSFLQPRSAADVQARGTMSRRWAAFSGGLLTETPEAVNTVLAAMATAAPYFAASDSRFGANVQEYYRRARRHDWCAAHTAIETASSGGKASSYANEAELRLELIERIDQGIVVNGARRITSLGPLAEELLVIPPCGLQEVHNAERLAICFATSCNARGLRLQCSEPPTPSRFNELQCIPIFDHVLIPWERVFLCGDVARALKLLDEIGAAPNLRHQQVIRNIVAAEFGAGCAARLAERCNALALPRVGEHLAARVVTVQLARALLHAAETRSQQDQWGQWVPQAQPLDAAMKLFTPLD